MKYTRKWMTIMFLVGCVGGLTQIGREGWLGVFYTALGGAIIGALVGFIADLVTKVSKKE